MTAALENTTRTQQAKVLVVDDDPWVHRMLGEKLASAQFTVHGVSSAAEALESAGKEDFDIILLDVGLPDTSGLDALRQLKAEAISAGVVMISGDDDAKNVVEAMRLGALDYLVKPLDPDKVVATVSLAVRTGRLERENRRLATKLRELNVGSELVGCSPPTRRLAGVLRRVAASDATVLLEGEPGSGKTAAARVVHGSGRRSGNALVAVTGDALTGENIDRFFAEADGGTLLIEDIDLLVNTAQSRLVRYLKERPSRIDAGKSPDVRIIATTGARLPELVVKQKFREDLYYRLNVFPIVMPTLRERRDDIALLATHFLKESAGQNKLTHKGFTAAAMILLESHPWPGNIAQLQNAVTRAHALAGGGAIDALHLLGPSTGLDVDTPDVDLGHSVKHDDDDDESVREEDILPLDTEEKRLLARALRATKGNVRRAAQLLRIGRATLYRKIQVYKLKLH